MCIQVLQAVVHYKTSWLAHKLLQKDLQFYYVGNAKKNIDNTKAEKQVAKAIRKDYFYF